MKPSRSKRRDAAGHLPPVPEQGITKNQGRVSLITGISFVSVFLISAVFGFREIFSPDLGFYLEMGKLAAEEHRVLFRDELTFSRAGAVVEHSPWLFGLIQWGLYRIGGTWAMVVAHTAMVLLVYATLLLRSRADLGRLSPWVAPWLLLFSLGSFWEIRPHTFSWLGLSLVCWAVESWSRGDRRWVWCVPVMMPFWANTHSLFVLGLAVMGLFALAEILPRRPWSREYVIAGLLAGLACFITPYWQTIATFPIKQFFVLSGGLIPSESVGLREFLSPFRTDFFTQLGPLILYQWVLFVQISGVIALLALMGVWKKRRIWEWLVFAAFGLLLFKAVKNYGYFMVATFPLVVAGLDHLGSAAIQRLRDLLPSRVDRWRPYLPLAGGGLVLAMTVVLFCQWRTGYLYQQDRSHHRVGYGFNTMYLPVEACEFLTRTLPAEVRLLNNWDTGGFVRWATGRKVFIDGRYEVMGEDFYREYLRFKDPSQLERMLVKWDMAAALVPLVDIPLWFHHFHHSPNWRLVYSDHRYALFYRADCAPSVPALPRPRKGTDYPDYSSAAVQNILERGLVRSDPGFWKSILENQHEPRIEMGWAAQYLLMGENQAAASKALEGLERSTFVAPDLLIYLGHAFYEMKHDHLALECYRKGLAHLNDPMAQERVRLMKAGRH
jgi:hypothetical protein